MFRDYLVGFLVSCGVFLTLIFGTQGQSTPETREEAQTEVVELVPLPEQVKADEEPAPTTEEVDDSEPLVMAPPQAVDIPSTAPINDSGFFQKLTAPPPLAATSGGMVIPKTSYHRATAPGTGDGGPIFVDKSQLDSPPRVRVRVNPNYPTDLQMAGVTGSVLVELSIEVDGSVSAVKVLRSTNVRFEQSVMTVIMRWRFEPGKIGGKKVRFRTTQPFDFNLNG